MLEKLYLRTNETWIYPVINIKLTIFYPSSLRYFLVYVHPSLGESVRNSGYFYQSRYWQQHTALTSQAGMRPDPAYFILYLFWQHHFHFLIHFVVSSEVTEITEIFRSFLWFWFPILDQLVIQHGLQMQILSSYIEFLKSLGTIVIQRYLSIYKQMYFLSLKMCLKHLSKLE